MAGPPKALVIIALYFHALGADGAVDRGGERVTSLKRHSGGTDEDEIAIGVKVDPQICHGRRVGRLLQRHAHR